MKTFKLPVVAACLTAIVTAGFLAATSAAAGGDVRVAATRDPSATGPTPAERAIGHARKIIAARPEATAGWNALALAMARRARETADPAWYAKGMEALEKSMSLEPANYEARRTRIWLLLGQHEFAAARREAETLNKEAPDDVLVYGFISDACIELGDYEAAEKAAQWMLDLRPGNVAGLTRGAHLRELFGDVEGAMEFFRQAFQRIRPDQVEDRAWILAHMAHLELGRGRVASAERLAKASLDQFAGYHYGLHQLARVRTAQGRHDEALALYEKHYAAAGHPENLLLVARARVRAGDAAKAEEELASFEKDARAESKNADNCNRELIEHLIETGRPQEALEIAEREFAKRRDVSTRNVYGWALRAVGRHAEAAKQFEAALSVGIRDAELLHRAGVVAAARGRNREAQELWTRSLAVNPSSPVAGSLRRLLSRDALGQ